MRDITGDGLPDHVMKYPGEDFLRVKTNAAGQVGLLRSVMLPQGGNIDMEYTPSVHSVDLPNKRRLMSAVTRSDGRECEEVQSFRKQFSWSSENAFTLTEHLRLRKPPWSRFLAPPGRMCSILSEIRKR